MKESFEGKPVSGLEIREGVPQVHTVYAYIKKGVRNHQQGQIARVMAIYTEKNKALKSTQMDDMFATEDSLVPLKVYERAEDLPKEIFDKIHKNYSDLTVEKKTGKIETIYAVLPNTDSTEGSGSYFIWALTTNPQLADKIAKGRGPSGSNAEIMNIPLNKYPIEKEKEIRPEINVRQD